MAFVQSLDPNNNRKSQSCPLYWLISALNTNYTGNQLKVETDIEKRIKSEVYQKGIRVREFFFDYDKLRKGVVTEDKVTIFPFNLERWHCILVQNSFINAKGLYDKGWCGRACEEIRNRRWVKYLIRRKIVNKKSLVRYDEFCKNIDAQFFDYDQAKNNLIQTKSTAVNKKEIVLY